MWLLSKAIVTMPKVFVDSLLLQVVISPNPCPKSQALLLGLSDDSAQVERVMYRLDRSALC
jgi:hypothetical protein